MNRIIQLTALMSVVAFIAIAEARARNHRAAPQRSLRANSSTAKQR